MKNLSKNLMALIAFCISAKQSAGQCTSTSVPYNESFVSITANNQLPLCWSSSNLGFQTQTFLANTEAGFVNTSSGNAFFLSPSISLFSSATYDLQITFRVNQTNNAFSNFGIALANNQATQNISPVSISTIQNTTPQVVNFTFSPSSSQTYSLLIFTTIGSNTGSEYLFWDNLNISAPCDLVPNTPTIVITPTLSTLCAFPPTSIVLTASGATNYTWSSGSFQNTTAVSQSTNMFTVVGKNAITGCSSSTLKALSFVTNTLIVIPTSTTICSGDFIPITALGATNYTWSNNVNSSSQFVSPTISTTYTVSGNKQGCLAIDSIRINVIQKPIISIIVSDDTICSGEAINVTALGANLYSFNFSLANTTNTFNFSPNSNSTLTIVGTSNEGCKATQTLQIVVETCNGLLTQSNSHVINAIYPNPSDNRIYIKGKFANPPQINVLDVTGKVIKSATLEKDQSLPISELKSGFYFIEIPGTQNRYRFQKL